MASPENRVPEKSSTDPASINLRFRTFLITLSPKQDVTEHTIKEFVNYLKKKTIYSYVVSEVGTNGKLHLHASAVWNVPVEKRNIFDYWSKKMVTQYEGSIGRYAVKVTVMYNHDWYDEYLRKGGTVLYDNYDRDRIDQYFPTAEQQEHLQSLKGVSTQRTHLYDQLLAEWEDKDPSDTSYESAIRFMNHRQHVEKKQPYYVDTRRLQQLCWFLYKHRNQVVNETFEDREFAARITGNTCTQTSNLSRYNN